MPDQDKKDIGRYISLGVSFLTLFAIFQTIMNVYYTGKIDDLRTDIEREMSNLNNKVEDYKVLLEGSISDETDSRSRNLARIEAKLDNEINQTNEDKKELDQTLDLFTDYIIETTERDAIQESNIEELFRKIK